VASAGVIWKPAIQAGRSGRACRAHARRIPW